MAVPEAPLTVSYHFPRRESCNLLKAFLRFCRRLGAYHPSMTLTGASVRAALLEQTERTRNCPKADIERIIEESESNLASLDSQINALIQLRDSQRADVLALRYIISPIRTLPVELLTEVFDLAIEDPTHIKDAYRISQICSDWRRVAHSTPRLWSRPLEVDLRRKKGGVDAYKAWLARSAPLPLSISLIPGYPLHTGIFAEILKAATRWCSLRILISGTQPPPWFVRQLSQCTFDSLEVLHLGLIEDDDDPTPIIFAAVPRLRKLSVISLLTAPQTLVPWDQLTDLILQTDPHEDIFSILAQCTSLVKVSVTTLPFSNLPRAKHDVVVLGRLHTLSLHFDDPMTRPLHHSPPIFDYLSTPSLQVLRLDFDEKYWSAAHLTAFQLRAPNITWLEFASRSLSSNDLVTAIRDAPLLTHLTLTFCTKAFNDAFIRTLHYQPGVTPLAPHLHNLVVKCEVIKFTQDILADMIVSRWSSNTSLEVLPVVASWMHVELEFGRMCTTLDLPRFADMLKDIPSNLLVVSLRQSGPSDLDLLVPNFYPS